MQLAYTGLVQRKGPLHPIAKCVQFLEVLSAEMVAKFQKSPWTHQGCLGSPVQALVCSSGCLQYLSTNHTTWYHLYHLLLMMPARAVLYFTVDVSDECFRLMEQRKFHRQAARL